MATGKTLTVTGPLHTIVSDLTFTGAGTTTISGPIDGGGVINISAARSRRIDSSRHGPVNLTGTTNYTGDITVQSARNALYCTARRRFRHI